MQTVKTGRDYTGNMIIKCGKCKHANRVAVAARIGCGIVTHAEIEAMNGHVRTGAREARGGYDHNDIRIQCACGGWHWLNQYSPVFGRYVEEIVCNGKCMNATRAACDCSCGGMNHGGSHAA